MQYISTRGKAKSLSFTEAVLTGLASDGGLYVPETIPQFTPEQLREFATLPFEQLMLEVIKPFIDNELSDAVLSDIINKAFRNFTHPAKAPLTQINHQQWILELFHGPTLAFKDFALQFLGQLLEVLLKEKKQTAVVLGATSGDTGSAAIEGCRFCENIRIFILHPHQRVSEVQRRQMTSVLTDNVFNVAIKGNFDDCQNIVKSCFSQQEFLAKDQRLIAVNSINWARIMAQVSYYFYATFALNSTGKKVSFSVPTGNFGDIYAGYIAKKMGLPIDKLIVATNTNDILHRCISENDYRAKSLQHSLSPSMDIMASSNFERLLFNIHNQDADLVSRLFEQFARDKKFTLSEDIHKKLQSEFKSFHVDDTATLQSMVKTYQESGYLLDPHTAIGVAAANAYKQNQDTLVCLATAHPAKFSEAISQAREYLPTLPEPVLPAHLSDLLEKEERFAVLDQDAKFVQSYIKNTLVNTA